MILAKLLIWIVYIILLIMAADEFNRRQYLVIAILLAFDVVIISSIMHGHLIWH